MSFEPWAVSYKLYALINGIPSRSALVLIHFRRGEECLPLNLSRPDWIAQIAAENFQSNCRLCEADFNDRVPGFQPRRGDSLVGTKIKLLR